MMKAMGTVLEPPDTFNFEASDVTGTHSVSARGVQRTLRTKDVADSLAATMALPMNVPWALRDESTSAFLDDEKSIGEQLRPGARVTLTPKTHLG